MSVPLVKFTVSEVAGHFGVSERYLSETAREKKLCGRAGRSLYFTEADIEALDKLWHGSGSINEGMSGGLPEQSLAGASEKARKDVRWSGGRAVHYAQQQPLGDGGSNPPPTKIAGIKPRPSITTLPLSSTPSPPPQG